jgi:hypothetical protein
MIQWCYNGFTVVLQWCYSGVTVVLQQCYSGVPGLSYHSQCFNTITGKQQCYSGFTACFVGVTVVLQWCYSCDTVVLTWCHSGVTVGRQQRANSREQRTERLSLGDDDNHTITALSPSPSLPSMPPPSLSPSQVTVDRT